MATQPGLAVPKDRIEDYSRIRESVLLTRPVRTFSSFNRLTVERQKVSSSPQETLLRRGKDKIEDKR
jgi:hypothetical protein